MDSSSQAAYSSPQVASVRYGFEESQNAEGRVFDVRPAPQPWFTILAVSLVSLALVGLFLVPLVTGLLALLLGFSAGGWGVLVLLGWAAQAYALHRGIQKTRVYLRPRHIVVRADGLLFEGRLYQRAHIRRIWVHYPNQPPDDGGSTTVVIGGGTMAHVGASLNEASRDAGRQIGRAAANKMNRVGHGLRMQYGADEVELAVALEETTALELMQRLHACLTAGDE